MSQIARVTSEHRGVCGHGATCCPHVVVGTIVQGSPDVFVDGLQVARLNDMVVHNCPHCGTGRVASASSKVIANGVPVARMGDSVMYPGGSGVISSGSPTTVTGR